MQASLVRKSQIVSDFRIDAECYKAEFFEIEKSLMELDHTTIGNEVKLFSKGIFNINAEHYTDEGIPFIRIADMKGMMIDESSLVYIPEEQNNLYLKTNLSYGDVILSKTAYPAASLVTLNSCNTSQDTIAMKIRGDSKIGSHFLVVFLNTKYGRPQMQRWFTGNIQMHLNLKDSRNIIVPIFSGKFQSIICQRFDSSISLLHKSKFAYKEAQGVLLSELGLLNWKPKHQLSFVKKRSDMDQVGRMDAEFFQPKYDEIVKVIKSYSGGWDTLGNLVMVKKCVEVGSGEYLDKGIPFVRVSNLSPYEISEEKYISEELYAGLLQHQPKQGEILLSKDGSPGIACYLREKPQRMIPSGGILRLKRKEALHQIVWVGSS